MRSTANKRALEILKQVYSRRKILNEGACEKITCWVWFSSETNYALSKMLSYPFFYVTILASERYSTEYPC